MRRKYATSRQGTRNAAGNESLLGERFSGAYLGLVAEQGGRLPRIR